MSNELTTILASGDVEKIVLGPQAQAYEEGQFFYDPVTKTLSFHCDIPDATLNIGQEHYIRVLNDTGATISNGQVCTHDGADVATQLPKAKLALADTLANAYILGVATHDILDGEQGLLTTHGKISTVDTSGLTPDVPAYLSDTVPGALTSTAPDIVSKIGGPLVVDPTNGAFFVLIDSTVALPALFGIMRTIPDIYNLTTVYQNLVNYQEEDSVIIPVDKLLGRMTLPNAGRFRGSFTITVTVPSSTSTRQIDVQAWNITQSAEALAYSIPIPRDTTEVSRSFSVPFTAVANDVLAMRIRSDVAISGVSIDFISFDIESIQVTS